MKNIVSKKTPDWKNNNRYPSRTSRLGGSYQPLGRTTNSMASYSHTPSTLPVTRSSLSFAKRVKLALVVFALLIFVSHSIWVRHVSAETAAAAKAYAAAVAVAEKKQAVLGNQLNSLMEANPTVDFSIVTYSKYTGMHSYGDKQPFDGASTGKLITASYFLHQVQIGATNLSTKIDGQSANYWLQKMLVDSDDTAWLELNDYLGHPQLSRYARSIGFHKYDVSTNSFTATDIALLLHKLSSGSLLAPNQQNLMLNYMAQANYRDYIVAAIPTYDRVYHKTGIDADIVNDASIIKSNDKSLILVIFTNGNGTYDWPDRAQVMHTITKDSLQDLL